MDEEMWDVQINDLESQLADAEMYLYEIRKEWEETYPYDTLEWCLEAIQRLGNKLLTLDPEDLEAQELLAEAPRQIDPKLLEPEVFYLR